MKVMKSLMFGTALVTSILVSGQAMAIGDVSDAYPYCKILQPQDPKDPSPNPLKDLLEKESNPDTIVDKLLDSVKPLAPTDLQAIYTKVFDQLMSNYMDTDKLDKIVPLQHKFDGKLNSREDLNKAVAELIFNMGDRWTWFTSASDQMQQVLDYLSKRAGLGIAVRQQKDDSWFIEHLSYGSAAQLDGFREGDTIIAVNDKEVAGKTKTEIDRMFVGPIGTSIKVKSIQDGNTVEQSYVIKASAGNPANAELLDKNIAYIKLPSFMSDEDFQKMVGGMVEMAVKTPGGIQGAVLDLRYNDGGSVEMAKTLLKLLVPNGTIINEESRDGDFQTLTTTKVLPLSAYDATKMPPEMLAVLKTLKTVPLVVLVNGSSASASEIVTGALKESRPNTTVIGEQSFGKFEEMIMVPLPDCSQFTVTSGRYTTPSGKWLHNEGIRPDIVVHQPRDSQDDAQMNATMKLLEAKTANNPVNIVSMEPSKQPNFTAPDRPKPEVAATDWKQMIADYRLQLMQGGVAAFLLSFLGAYVLLGWRKKDD